MNIKQLLEKSNALILPALIALLLALASQARAQFLTNCVAFGSTKFDLPPALNGGSDVFDSHGIIVADDFRCTETDYLTTISVYGSWLSDSVGLITNFIVTIYDDVPTNTTNAFSHPGTNVLWRESFGPSQYCTVTNWFSSECFYNPSNSQTIGGDTMMVNFTFYPANPFLQTGSAQNPTNYWLSVYAQVAGTNLFGWKTSSSNYNDTAVWVPANNSGLPRNGFSWSSMSNLNCLSTNHPVVNLSFSLVTTNTSPIVTCVETNHLKYVQYPNINAFPLGWDIWNSSSNAVTPADGAFVVADDFICTNTGPINEIHLWGSWLNDQAAPNSLTFDLAIYSDVPASNGVPSHPGNLLYQQSFSPGQYAESISATGQGYFLDPSQGMLGSQIGFGQDTNIWYYCFYPANFHQFGTFTNPTTYWLAAFAQLPLPLTNLFGWKTTTNLQHDVSVHEFWAGALPGYNTNWVPTYAPGTPSPVAEDLAFKIDTGPNPCTGPSLSCSNFSVPCGTGYSVPTPTVIDSTNCCATNGTPALMSVVTNSFCPAVISYNFGYTNCQGQTAFCSTIVTVTSTPPVITCSPNKTVACGSSWTFDTPTASDTCCQAGAIVYILSTITNNMNTCTQTVTRTWLATGCCYNSSNTCSQVVTVVNTNLPAIVCPTNMIVYTCDSFAVVTWPLPQATAACGAGISSVVTVPPSGSAFATGTTNTVLGIAVDGCHNTNFCTFTVAVLQAPLPLGISYLSPFKVVLTWMNGMLLAATNLAGPYLDLPAATSPYTISTVPPAPPNLGFYRLRCPVCDPTPLGITNWWPGEGNALDIVGNKNGNFPNGIAWVFPGLVGQAFSFNGVNQYLQIPGFLNTVPNTEITIEFWQKVTTVKVQSTFSASSFVSGSVLNAHIPYSDGKVYWDFGDISTGGRLIYTPSDSLVGTWQHFALIASQSGANNPDGSGHFYMAIYRNGVLVANQNTMTPFIHANLDLDIGGAASLGLSYGGLIDEFSIYARALSSNEVSAIYHAGSAGKCPIACVAAPSGLVAWWPAQNNANDIIGGNNGSLQNGATFTSGEVGSAFSLDGVNDYISVPHNAAFNFGNAITIEAWLKTANSANTYIITKGEDSFFLSLGGGLANNKLAFYLNGVSGDWLRGTSDLNDNQWHHVAATYDGPSIKIYVDGNLQNSSAAGGFNMLSGTSPISIGARGSANTFSGALDEVSLYNRALSAAEIQAIYHAGASGKCAP